MKTKNKLIGNVNKREKIVQVGNKIHSFGNNFAIFRFSCDCYTIDLLRSKLRKNSCILLSIKNRVFYKLIEDKYGSNLELLEKLKGSNFIATGSDIMAAIHSLRYVNNLEIEFSAAFFDGMIVIDKAQLKRISRFSNINKLKSNILAILRSVFVKVLTIISLAVEKNNV